MEETEDRLAIALIEVNDRMTALRVQIREDKAKIKGVLRELDEEGVIDLERLAKRHAGGSKAERRDILRE